MIRNNNEIKQLSIGAIVAYHLLPGVPILLLTILFANPTWGFGLPIFLSLMLAILFGLIPVQLGILAVVARKQEAKIRDIISFKSKMSLGKTLAWSIPLLLFCIAGFGLLSAVEHPLWSIFDWVPQWFRLDLFDFGDVSKGMVWLMLVLGFLFNGVFGPYVEELYFRGFLLPRMNRLGKAAPLVNVVLFSIYHLFTPWQNITRIVALTPMVYGVWYNKNIRIGIIVHMALNIGSMVMMAIAVLGQ